MEQIVEETALVRQRQLLDLPRAVVDLRLVYCGSEYCDAGHRFGPNRREEELLHVILDGSGTLEMNGCCYKLEKGEAFYIPKGKEAYYEADKSDPWQYVWVGFSGIIAKDTIQKAGFSENSPVRPVPAVMEKLREYVEHMLEAYQLNYGDELMRQGYLMQFFSVLVSDYRQMAGKQEGYEYPFSVYVNQAVDYMRHHYDARIRISDLAGYVGVNRCYLTNIFKKVYGISPQQYLIRLRMERAAAMIKNSGSSISQIAESVGYEDALAFSKIFKQNFGMSPKAYREK
ncbi:MAG: AraC family transcriptional regulator [Lachnospiraceae bacterium]|nr:AraC family transcriptional regulator [Lachnospiraceae bacterium]